MGTASTALRTENGVAAIHDAVSLANDTLGKMPRSKMRVLLVEDDAAHFALTREWLETTRPGCFHLDWVQTFESGLEAINRGEHDVYLLDCMLGGCDGMDLLRTAVRNGCRAPIIMLTGQNDPDVDERAREAGAADYLGKHEISGPMLDRAIRYACSHKESETRLRQQLMRIKLLNRIARAVTERHDLDSIFHIVLRHLEDEMPIDFGSICLFDLQSGTITARSRGPKSRSAASEMGLSDEAAFPLQSCFPCACHDAKFLYIPDTTCERSICIRRLSAGGIRSLVSAPLAMGAGKALGVLVAARKRLNAFDSVECEFLRSLSEHVGLAARQAALQDGLKKAYEDLRQTQRAVMQQERLRALGQMASGIAHDINNALSPVIGYADLLWKTKHELSKRAQGYLDAIRTSGRDAAHLVSRLREFYRPRQANEELSPINLSQLISQVVYLTQPRWQTTPMAQGVSVKLETALPPELPTITGVESELREALTNLIFNAADAMPKGGILTIRVRLDLPDPESPAAVEKVIVEVVDTGVGMDEKMRQRCMEPFFTTKGDKGTGLGLAMVYGVMQRHNGDIEIESEVGQGTTVRLVFPTRSRTASDETLALHVGERPARALRILCIDDDPILRHLLREMLEDDGHIVTVADGGLAGLKEWHEAFSQKTPFDAVMTDLGMPYVNGRDVARMIKRDAPRTPVVLLTGWGTRMGLENTRDMPVDYVLSKPPKLEEVRRALAMAALAAETYVPDADVAGVSPQE